jgi:tRNA U38,U39,U40 pseudouridine synthase TruA
MLHPSNLNRSQKDAYFREQNPKVKVALVCGFIGTGFHGSCYQGDNAATMTIELAVKRALIAAGIAGRTCSRKAKGWNSCSRVDAGVHAERWLLTTRYVKRKKEREKKKRKKRREREREREIER